MLEDRLVVSPDKTCVGLLIGSFFTPPFHDVRVDDLHGKRKVVIYTRANKQPVYISDDSRYVYSGPVFSAGSKLMVYAFAQGWRESEQSYEHNGEIMKYDVGAWDEKVCVIDMRDLSERIVASEETVGYGEWANPFNFMSMQFL